LGDSGTTAAGTPAEAAVDTGSGEDGG
jgi:hypothetical protein